MKRRKNKKSADIPLVDHYSDDNFAFIAGYTSGGAPYGITWELPGDRSCRSVDITIIDPEVIKCIQSFDIGRLPFSFGR